MVSIGSLWLAIVISSVLVWVASFLVWVALPHHKSDYRGLPNEEAARSTLTPQKLPPGQYNIPHLQSRSDLNKPEALKKFEEGPVGFLTVLPTGVPSMGRSMVLSFVFYALVGFVVAYLAGRTLPAGVEYLQAFRVTGTVAWVAYGFAVVPDAIWFGRPWSAIAKQLFDALIYALLTAGTFGWLWPR
jgi:hypothetical protein